MKRILCVLLLIALAFSISGCGQSKSTVYKFDSVKYEGAEDDPFQAIGVALISEKLKGSYIEIKADGSMATYSPSDGYSENTNPDWTEDGSDDLKTVISGDYVSVSDGELTITFIKATQSEEQYYRDMVKESQKP